MHYSAANLTKPYANPLLRKVYSYGISNTDILRRYEKLLTYKVDDKDLLAQSFISFVNKVWPGNYDVNRTETALSKTLNISAYDDQLLVGCIRILSDGYYFGTITELLVLPEYQKQGIGSHLIQLAKEHTPTTLYFGAQPGVESFYEKNGCIKGIQAYTIKKRRQ